MPPVQPMPMVSRRLALGDVGRDGEREEVVEEIEEALGDRAGASTNVADLVGQAGQRSRRSAT